MSENIDKNEFPQVKWVYDYRNDHDDPIFIKEDKTIDEDARDKKYRDEAKDGDDVKGWLPLYHPNGYQCFIKVKIHSTKPKRSHKCLP